MNRKGQTTVLRDFLFGFLFFALLGVTIFTFATTNVQPEARGYNETELEALDISPSVSSTFDSLEGIVNRENATSFGEESPSQVDLLLFTARDLSSFLWNIPSYIYGVLELAADKFGVSMLIVNFAIFVLVVLLIAIFVQLAVGRTI